MIGSVADNQLWGNKFSGIYSLPLLLIVTVNWLWCCQG